MDTSVVGHGGLQLLDPLDFSIHPKTPHRRVVIGYPDGAKDWSPERQPYKVVSPPRADSAPPGGYETAPSQQARLRDLRRLPATSQGHPARPHTSAAHRPPRQTGPMDLNAALAAWEMQRPGSMEEAQARRWALKVCLSLAVSALHRQDTLRASKLLSLLKALSLPFGGRASEHGAAPQHRGAARPGSAVSADGRRSGEGAMERVLRDGVEAVGDLARGITFDSRLQGEEHLEEGARALGDALAAQLARQAGDSSAREGSVGGASAGHREQWPRADADARRLGGSDHDSGGSAGER
ncbi:hypothetical protein T484DRAFT_1895319, partial [Baffinella frigidus]